jgi:hypothetical protein
MGLSFALDELLSTGWSGLDSTGCSYDTDGRAYPTVARVQQEFAMAGFELTVTEVAKFNCYRAEWREAGDPAAATQAVVSQAEAEAAVYALAQFRRSLAAAPVGAGA